MESLEEITLFIERETFELSTKLSHHDESKIIIAMPDYILSIWINWMRSKVSGFVSNADADPDANHSNIRFAGYLIQSHYRDEVIVFYKDYHKNPKLFEPKIYTIKYS